MKKILLMVVALAFVFGLNAQSRVTLRLNLNKGQEFKQYMDILMKMDMDVMEQKMTFDVPFAAVIQYKVNDIDKSGNYIIETSYKQMKIKIDVAGQKLEYSSEDKLANENSEVANLLNGMIDQPFFMTLDKYCNVVEVKGLDKLLDNMVKKYSSETRDVMRATLESSLGTKKMIENFESASFIFPQEDIYKGYSWKRQTTKEISGINLVVDNIYTVTDVKDKTIKISYNSNWSMNGDIKEDSISTHIKMKKSFLEGTFDVDKTSGWVLDSDSKMFMDMEITTKQGEKSVVIPMTITGTITVKKK